MTLGEITIVVKAFNRKEEARQNEIRSQIYYTSLFTAAFISNGLAGKPNPSYEEVFGIQQTNSEELSENERLAMEMYKEQFIEFAKRRNEKLKQTEGDE